GDNYFAAQPERAAEEVVALIAAFRPELVLAGPAFNAGRYGPACGAVCKAVQERLGVPAVTGMYHENPGVDLYRRHIFCVATGPSAAGMQEAVGRMVRLGLKLASGVPLGLPEEEGYLPRGLRRNVWADRCGAARAVDMLLAKVRGEPYRTELPLPAFERIPPAPAVRDLARATVALVTEGGIVPAGNPDRLESARATKVLAYSLKGMEALKPGEFQSVHGGYDNSFANADPNRVVPLDVMRDLEREGVIGRLHEVLYTTTGNGTTIPNAVAFAREVATRVKEAGVDAVVLTST
ncbi:MAG: glycine/betaine/sarcosine/D-proline family reductase selenoprotein B, partial [Firmicutes bacterium]|nr:glycine/betaine/sarcosine/D-proline family reductase selenoprotein B [Bacillota bacterium]